MKAETIKIYEWQLALLTAVQKQTLFFAHQCEDGTPYIDWGNTASDLINFWFDVNHMGIPAVFNFYLLTPPVESSIALSSKEVSFKVQPHAKQFLLYLQEKLITDYPALDGMITLGNIMISYALDRISQIQRVFTRGFCSDERSYLLESISPLRHQDWLYFNNYIIEIGDTTSKVAGTGSTVYHVWGGEGVNDVDSVYETFLYYRNKVKSLSS